MQEWSKTRECAVAISIQCTVHIPTTLGQLVTSGDGEKVHGLFMGCLAYADNITLLSLTVSGLERMLNICESYGKEHSLAFNVFGGNISSCQPTVSHLG